MSSVLAVINNATMPTSYEVRIIAHSSSVLSVRPLCQQADYVFERFGRRLEDKRSTASRWTDGGWMTPGRYQPAQLLQRFAPIIDDLIILVVSMTASKR